MNIQTIWQDVEKRIPKPPTVRGNYTKSQKEIPKIELDDIPKRMVQVIDYEALFERLSNGSITVASVDFPNVSYPLRQYGVQISKKTTLAEVNGVVQQVVTLRIKE